MGGYFHTPPFLRRKATGDPLETPPPVIISYTVPSHKNRSLHFPFLKNPTLTLDLPYDFPFPWWPPSHISLTLWSIFTGYPFQGLQALHSLYAYPIKYFQASNAAPNTLRGVLPPEVTWLLGSRGGLFFEDLLLPVAGASTKNVIRSIPIALAHHLLSQNPSSHFAYLMIFQAITSGASSLAPLHAYPVKYSQASSSACDSLTPLPTPFGHLTFHFSWGLFFHDPFLPATSVSPKNCWKRSCD